MNKRKFISLIKKYNALTIKEHESYMRRGLGGRYDWYDIRYSFDEKMNKIDIEFAKTFKSLIPKKEFADFSLGYYDTDNPEYMYKVWTGEIKED